MADSQGEESVPDYVKWKRDFDELLDSTEGYGLFKQYLKEDNLDFILDFR